MAERCLGCDKDKTPREGLCAGCVSEFSAESDRYRKALERIASYAYGASGVTGDDAGHLTEVGMVAREALDG